MKLRTKILGRIRQPYYFLLFSPGWNFFSIIWDFFSPGRNSARAENPSPVWSNQTRIFSPGWIAFRAKCLRASSYDPGRPGWLGFRDLAWPLFSLLKYRCVHTRGRAGPVTEISVFATEISVTGMKISHINTPARWPGGNFLNKIASLSQHSGQNGIILVLYIFPL